MVKVSCGSVISLIVETSFIGHFYIFVDNVGDLFLEMEAFPSSSSNQQECYFRQL